MNHRIDRRMALRGLGAACFLPQLDIMASPPKPGRQSARFCSVFFPFGVTSSKRGRQHPAFWYPEDTGRDYKATPSLEPLKHREEFSILTGLSHPQCRHMAHVTNHYMTGSSLKRGVVNHESIDQVIARNIGRNTRVQSLLLSTSDNSISIGSKGKALPALKTPRAAFEYLFSGKADPQEVQRRRMANQKVADSVLEDFRLLQKKLGQHDRAKMDEFLTAVNEAEEKIRRAEKWDHTPYPDIAKTAADFSGDKAPAEEFFDMMYELIYLAFETDQTRVASMMYGAENASSSMVNRFASQVIGGGNLHVCGHKYQFDKTAKWDRFLSERLHIFIDRLKNSTGEYGSLLDNTVILHGSSTSTLHNYRNYPLILAGGRNLGYRHGTHRSYSEDVPFTNLFVSIANSVGVPVDDYHDSTGRIEDIFAEV
ncbi:MAG: DUF1552 domain-containing protein [Planctomycetaceae bacterium]